MMFSPDTSGLKYSSYFFLPTPHHPILIKLKAQTQKLKNPSQNHQFLPSGYCLGFANREIYQVYLNILEFNKIPNENIIQDQQLLNLLFIHNGMEIPDDHTIGLCLYIMDPSSKIIGFTHFTFNLDHKDIINITICNLFFFKENKKEDIEIKFILEFINTFKELGIKNFFISENFHPNSNLTLDKIREKINNEKYLQEKNPLKDYFLAQSIEIDTSSKSKKTLESEQNSNEILTKFSTEKTVNPSNLSVLLNNIFLNNAKEKPDHKEIYLIDLETNGLNPLKESKLEIASISSSNIRELFNILEFKNLHIDPKFLLPFSKPADSNNNEYKIFGIKYENTFSMNGAIGYHYHPKDHQTVIIDFLENHPLVFGKMSYCPYTNIQYNSNINNEKLEYSSEDEHEYSSDDEDEERYDMALLLAVFIYLKKCNIHTILILLSKNIYIPELDEQLQQTTNINYPDNKINIYYKYELQNKEFIKKIEDLMKEYLNNITSKTKKRKIEDKYSSDDESNTTMENSKITRRNF